MERPRQKMFDPVFAPRATGQHAPAYTRRASHYRSVSGIADIRPMTGSYTPVLDITKPAVASPGQRTHATSDVSKRVCPAGIQAKEPTAETTIAPARQEMPRMERLRVLLPNKQTALLYSMATFIFIIGIVVSLNGLSTNRQVAAQVRQGQQQTNKSVTNKVVPSTTKPSATVVEHYAVSPNLPRYVDIPKLKVHARVLSEGITKGGQLQVPWNIYDTGWYNASSQPGQLGGMLIDGHSGLGGMHGVFYRLGQLAAGDVITVTRGDGKQFTYVVTRVQTVNVTSVDMASMLVSSDTNKPGLNLITCAGDQIPGTTELNKRVLVYAVLQ